MNFLTWINRISEQGPHRWTQYSAGYYDSFGDIDFTHRFFVHIPDYGSSQQVDAIELQWCDRGGVDLLAERARILGARAARGAPPLDSVDGDDFDDDDLENQCYTHGGNDSVAEFDELIREFEARLTTLTKVCRGCELVIADVWRHRAPRGDYVGE